MPRSSRFTRKSLATLAAIWWLPASVTLGFNRPPMPDPNASDDVLVTAYAYDAAGRQSEVTDNAEVKTRTEYDALGRPRKVIENYDDGVPLNSQPDVDRVTLTTYTASSQVATLTADLEGAANDQTTYYIYTADLTTITSTTAPVKSGDFLYAVVYPDAAAGASLTTRAAVVSAINAATLSDAVFTTYYADGSLKTRTDQRGTVLTYTYATSGGVRLAQAVTSLGGDTDGSVRAITYQYDALLRLTYVTSHGNATSDPTDTTSVRNQVRYAYDGLGQVTTEYQDHDGVVDTSGPGTGGWSWGTPRLSYAFDDAVAANVFTKGRRRAKVTYPNGHALHLAYGAANGVDDLASRVAALAHDDGSGAPGQVIASFDRLGSGRVVRKNFPTPHVRLDYTDGAASSPTYAGLDRFGRITRQHWVAYDPNTGVNLTPSQGGDVFNIEHAYDHASNRLYAHNTVYADSSQLYAYDGLHRLKRYEEGRLQTDTQGRPVQPAAIPDGWTRDHKTDWTLTALGNPTQQTNLHGTDWEKAGFNNANEVAGTQTKAGTARYINQTFTNSADASSWESTSTNDQFDIDVTTNDRLTVTAVAQDTLGGITEEEPRAIITRPAVFGPPIVKITFAFPVGATSGQAGLVYGYQSPNDYWIHVFDLAAKRGYDYHVVNGVKGPALTQSAYMPNLTGGSQCITYLKATDTSISSYTFTTFSPPGGVPSGRLGLYTTVPGTTFEYLRVYPQNWPAPLTPRWINYQQASIDNTADELRIPHNDDHIRHGVFLRDSRARRFQATFSLRSYNGNTNTGVAFVFNAQDNYLLNAITIYHKSTPTAPQGDPSATRIPANMPTLVPSNTLWVRVTHDGYDVRVRCAASQAGLDTAADAYIHDSGPLAGGLIGFRPNGGGAGAVDNLTFKTDADGDGSFETTELIEDFTLDNSYANDAPTHDPAGNLTYDGSLAYAYDAWNRMVQVKRAFRSPSGSGTLQYGSVISTSAYDGLGRRITKVVSNSGDLDMTYHFYYEGQSIAEIRDGSELVLKQHVWATLANGYIDELLQTTANRDLFNNPSMDIPYPWGGGPWADPLKAAMYDSLHDANYNIQGLIEDATEGGNLAERYEYTPYGQRLVLRSTGGNDPLCHAPIFVSQRQASYTWTLGTPEELVAFPQPFGLNEFGHQGLYHDEETAPGGGAGATLIYNRARMLHTRLGRFTQRDPLGYVDGMSGYAAYRSTPIARIDSSGTIIADSIAGVNNDGQAELIYTTNNSTCRIRFYVNGSGGYVISGKLQPPGKYKVLYNQSLLAGDSALHGHSSGVITLQTDGDGDADVKYSIAGKSKHFQNIIGGRLYNTQTPQGSAAPFVGATTWGDLKWREMQYSVPQSGRTRFVSGNNAIIAQLDLNPIHEAQNIHGSFLGGVSIAGGPGWKNYIPPGGTIGRADVATYHFAPTKNYWFDSLKIKFRWMLTFGGHQAMPSILGGGLGYTITIP